jgi:hypothetical protein
VTVGASAITDFTGTGANFSSLLLAKTASDISLSGSFNAHLTGTSTVNQLIAVDNATSGTLLTDALTDSFTNINTLLSSLNYTALIASITGTITVNGTNASETIDMTRFALLHAVTINGQGLNDSISGTGLSDIINGGAGTDEIMGNGGADTISGGVGTDTFIYNVVSDSSITTTNTPASGFDLVYIDNTDSFNFAYTFDSPNNVGVNAVTSLVTSLDNMALSGTDVLNQLNTAFISVDNGVSDYEASIVHFNSGENFLVLDSNQDQIIDTNDQIIQISGVVTGLTINGNGEVIIN